MAVDNNFATPQPDKGLTYPVEQDENKAVRRKSANAKRLDSPDGIKLHNRLITWWDEEKDRQQMNRFQMALDEDFYDGLQWSDEDAHELMMRAQAPLVYNMVHPTIEWITGTERRTRIDANVIPRTKDDVEDAYVKNQLLKYVSDINRVPFNRSRAFKDCITAGLGWLEDGVRGDESDDPLLSQQETWRNMWYDGLGRSLDGQDWRYCFRAKNIDLDMAQAMFPDRYVALKQAALRADTWEEGDEESWYLGSRLTSQLDAGLVLQRRSFTSSFGWTHSRRSRVRLIECWYRVPARVKIMRWEQPDALDFEGQTYDDKNEVHRELAGRKAVSLYNALRMQVRCAIMTERALVQELPSPYNHNRFPFTPLWCYRRSRDMAPYGIVRNIRDPQEDLNKRRSKSLHILSTKQAITDSDATDDWDELRDELAAPDGIMKVKRGSRFEIVEQTALAQAHAQQEERDGQYIREGAGVTGENLGLDTNARSGKAIIAKQQQGALVTATPFDNLRLAIQVQGEIQLSLIEQFYTEPKVIALTDGASGKGPPTFVSINEPQLGENGELLGFDNDITKRNARFVVDEIDFRESVRSAMFVELLGLVGELSKADPRIALQLLDHVMEMSDVPGKDEMIATIRKISGKVDTSKPLSEEEKKQMQEAIAAQQKQAQRDEAMQESTLDKLQAQVGLLNAQATKALSDAGQTADGESTAIQEANIKAGAELQREAMKQSGETERTQIEANVETHKAHLEHHVDLQSAIAEHRRGLADIDSKYKSEIEKAHTQGASDIQVAQINAAHQKELDKMGMKLQDIEKRVKATEKGQPRPTPKRASSGNGSSNGHGNGPVIGALHVHAPNAPTGGKRIRMHKDPATGDMFIDVNQAEEPPK